MTVNKQTSAWQMPDTLIIVLLVLLLSALMTVFIPRGVFDVELQQETNRRVVIADSFRYANDGNAQSTALFSSNSDAGFLNALFDGLTSGDRNGAAIGVVVFILIVGGSFGLVLQTGAVTEFIHWITHKLKHRAIVLIPVFVFVFSLGGAVFGMGEEAMVFAIFMVPMVRAMGYDAVTGVLITYAATQVGFAASWMNPFSVAIAQGIAQIPILSGAGFRLLMWFAITALFCTFVVMRCARIRRQPDEGLRALSHQFKAAHGLILLVFAATMAWMIWGVTLHGYYLREIATQFFTMGILCALIAALARLPNCRTNDLADAFKHGSAQLLPAALVVGLAQGIMIVLGGVDPTQASLVNTLLHAMVEGIGDTPPWLAAQLMLVFQSCFNFFVSSGSAQAALTMPLMAPLADLLGVTRQTAVLAFQLADGLSNLVYPTSAALMGTLAVANVSFIDWLKSIWKLQLLLALFSMVVIAIATTIGFN